jgi:hypothetical protein
MVDPGEASPPPGARPHGEAVEGRGGGGGGQAVGGHQGQAGGQQGGWAHGCSVHLCQAQATRLIIKKLASNRTKVK